MTESRRSICHLLAALALGVRALGAAFEVGAGLTGTSRRIQAGPDVLQDGHARAGCLIATSANDPDVVHREAAYQLIW